MSAGWDARSAVERQSGIDELRRMGGSAGGVDDAELLGEFTASIKWVWWAPAALHEAGAGMEAGPHLHQARRRLGRLQVDGDYSELGLQLQVMIAS